MNLNELEALMMEQRNDISKLENARKKLEKILRSAIAVNDISGVDLTEKLNSAKTELTRCRDVIVAEVTACETFFDDFKG